MKLTHSELEKIAEKWLRKRKRCKLVLVDYHARISERPDAIGWHNDTSFVIECKTSRRDFLRDRKKKSRRMPNTAMGNMRYYMAPPGVVPVEKLPPGWGLLEIHKSRVYVKKRAKRFRSNVTMLRMERFMLTNALMRALSVDPTRINIGKLKAKAEFLEYKLRRKTKRRRV